MTSAGPAFVHSTSAGHAFVHVNTAGHAFVHVNTSGHVACIFPIDVMTLHSFHGQRLCHSLHWSHYH